uniref:Uncharacterized protein n=1 Tax=Glossina palpalis gambiensis TaxID=67801 RepID=A0A1B0C1D7_9MUSC
MNRMLCQCGSSPGVIGTTTSSIGEVTSSIVTVEVGLERDFELCVVVRLVLPGCRICTGKSAISSPIIVLAICNSTNCGTSASGSEIVIEDSSIEVGSREIVCSNEGTTVSSLGAKVSGIPASVNAVIFLVLSSAPSCGAGVSKIKLDSLPDDSTISETMAVISGSEVSTTKLPIFTGSVRCAVSGCKGSTKAFTIVMLTLPTGVKGPGVIGTTTSSIGEVTSSIVTVEVGLERDFELCVVVRLVLPGCRICTGKSAISSPIIVLAICNSTNCGTSASGSEIVIEDSSIEVGSREIVCSNEGTTVSSLGAKVSGIPASVNAVIFLVLSSAPSCGAGVSKIKLDSLPDDSTISETMAVISGSEVSTTKLPIFTGSVRCAVSGCKGSTKAFTIVMLTLPTGVKVLIEVETTASSGVLLSTVSITCSTTTLRAGMSTNSTVPSGPTTTSVVVSSGSTNVVSNTCVITYCSCSIKLLASEATSSCVNNGLVLSTKSSNDCCLSLRANPMLITLRALIRKSFTYASYAVKNVRKIY